MEKWRRESLSYSVKDGVCWSINEGLGAYYASPFAVALGASEVQVGFLTSVPNLVANASDLATPRLMEGRSRKKLVTDLALIQALVWLPMSLLSLLVFFLGIRSALLPLLVVLFYGAYLTLGALNGPVWSSWMGDLVPEKERGRFFGMRNRWEGLANLSSMLAAGLFLELCRREGVLFLGFALIFFLAMVARLLSRHFLLKQREPRFREEERYHFGFTEFLKKIWNRGGRPNRFGRFALYVVCMSFAVNLAAPFFTVYMLRNLRFSYSTFVMISLSSASVRLLSMPLWGRFSDRYGRLTLLRLGGLLIPWVPMLWILTTNPACLSAIEMLSGFSWAAFDLATFTYVYDVVTRQRRGICFSYMNALNGMGIFAGATLGGFLATRLNLGLGPILSLFLLSGVLRLAVSLSFLPHLHEVRKVTPHRPLWMYPRSLVRKKYRV